MERHGKTVTLGQKPCMTCNGKGTRTYGPIRCTTCGGSGKGPRGGRHGCRTCNGYGHTYGEVPRYTCDRCAGSGKEDEWHTDWVADGFLPDDFPIRVIYADRGISFNESLLGLGRLFSVQDYGRAWDERDEARLIAEVRADRPQLSTISRESEDGDGTFTLCDGFVIVVTRGGWSAAPYWGDAPTDPGADELDADSGMVYGIAVANRGGNGTLAAATATSPAARKRRRGGRR